MRWVVLAVVGFFAVVSLVAYLKKRNYHTPDLDAPTEDDKK